MKTAEEQYYDVCEKYRKHCELNGVDQDDAKFNELLEDSYKEYATAAVKEHLSRAADRSLLEKVGISIEQWQTLHKTITNTEIILS